VEFLPRTAFVAIVVVALAHVVFIFVVVVGRVVRARV
jgi:hypothetical protein